ncbi:ABC transporter ATP-binding protein [Streptomyces europaeiscabiei]|uniref:ABC transporter ATP-binding protein n=1 Tax=Streptomyces europaeiscabiei TaxID=146819 RepID=UPI000A8657E8|nr:ABC transporter ATP-binding protein [Streptomyces europaeiscabiei]MDX3668209.1 ABC transporter ATP-binding protein [Streptomyces europaeiscabiei]MDX3708936.1 ABC transporter ATP-binding protein [Streptomyces europaeiscabiei]MDX3864509.1 ABC transporter ATP-binding protein [Streptomyces europaeiscabiei]MDX3871409.1 ABC transporter ATP-binding protein [Streptomyces europaeiscabiei]
MMVDQTVATPEGQGLRLGADLVSGHRLQLGAAALLALLSTAATVAVPLMVRDLVEALSGSRGLVWPVTLMALVAIGGALAATTSGFLLARIGEKMILRLRARVMDHALRLPLREVRAQGEGNLVARITSDAMMLRSIVDVGAIQLPLAVITVMFTLVVMSVLDWVLVLITIASFALAGAAIGFVIVRVRRSIIAQQTALGELAQRFTATLAALPTIKAYRAESRAAGSLGEDAAELTESTLVSARLQSLIGPVMGLGQQIALVSIILGGGARMAAGDLSMPDFTAFLLYLLQLVAPVAFVASGIGQLQAGLAARARFDELLAIPQETDGGTTSGLVPDKEAPAVEFGEVSFAYDDEPVLTGVSFTAPRRGLTALVGRSGAGKSTVLTLIERFLHPESGSIRVLGHDVHAWPLDQLRKRVAYVDQSFTLLEGTVRDNLLLGRDDVPDDAALLEALEAVSLREVVLQLPEGLETALGRATDLSGGQRQRLALARALLTDADIILLDEPTSQLDSINEHRLRDTVDELAKTRCVIVVAHRLSTVQHADHVLVMEAGSVLDSGTHGELLSRCAQYEDLVRSQQWTASDEQLLSQALS